MGERRGDIIEQSDAGEIGQGGQPEWLQERLEWFQDMKFGLFLHWGIYCQWDCCESWPLVEVDDWSRPDHLKCWTERDRDFARFTRDYRALNRTFNPVDFDPAIWAEAAGYAGMKYVTFTSKHHDGFCMWDTGTTDYRITHADCPFHADPRADIARGVFDAFRARDLAISCYFSKSDWHVPYYWSPDWPAKTRNPNYDTHALPELWEKFVQYTHRQIEELMSGYGPIDALWLDGGQVRPPDQNIRMDEIAAMGRRHQPGRLVADRTVGGPHENFVTPEQTIPDAPLEATWESCLTMGHSWKYVPDDRCKPTGELIRMLVEVVAKGGNLLLGTGPTPQGTLTDEALGRLREIGDWMQVNSEAIYGTRPIAPYRNGEVFFTCKGERVYAICFADEPPAEIAWSGLRPAEGVSMQLLGQERELEWRDEDGKVRVRLSSEMRNAVPVEGPWVLEFMGRV